nr:cache domain-containing protein [Desulfobacter hydrogenophilus]
MAMDKNAIRKTYGDNVKALVNQAIAVFEANNTPDNFRLLKNRRADAVKVIDKMRWGVDGKNYFWFQDMTGHMVHHHLSKYLNGKPLGDIKDPDCLHPGIGSLVPAFTLNPLKTRPSRMRSEPSAPSGMEKTVLAIFSFIIPSELLMTPVTRPRNWQTDLTGSLKMSRP